MDGHRPSKTKLPSVGAVIVFGTARKLKAPSFAAVERARKRIPAILVPMIVATITGTVPDAFLVADIGASLEAATTRLALALGFPTIPLLATRLAVHRAVDRSVVVDTDMV